MKDKFKEGDVVVVLFHDHGSRYVGKMFNDDWMRERGFLNEGLKSAADLVGKHGDRGLVTCGSEELVSHAVAKIKTYDISQIPVTKDGKIVGYIDDAKLYQALIENPSIMDAPLHEVMENPLPVVSANTSIDKVSILVNKHTPAVLVDLGDDKFHIITRHDLISAMA